MASLLLRNARPMASHPTVCILNDSYSPLLKRRILHYSAKLLKPPELATNDHQNSLQGHDSINLSSFPTNSSPPSTEAQWPATGSATWIPPLESSKGAAITSEQARLSGSAKQHESNVLSYVGINKYIEMHGTPSIPRGLAYWQRVGRWSQVTHAQFLSHRWQVANTIDKDFRLYAFLNEVVPDTIPAMVNEPATDDTTSTLSREAFLADITEGMKIAPMAVRLTPHILSVIDWTDPLNDPIRKQFLPIKSTMKPDHPALEFDSLHETNDSPVPGLVHRYPDKVLFLATSVCPVYCRFCTRSYAIGASTESNLKKTAFKPGLRRWEPMFDYIKSTAAIQDVVVSGGDAFYLQPEQLKLLGERLLAMPNVKRIRIATKGLAVSPSRFLDGEDGWTDVLIDLSKSARLIGKQIALHTHINHPKEMTWVTDLAARRLFAEGVIVRNQSVLLKGVNDDVFTMSQLIRQLADANIQPYYVYQGDLVKGVEDLRTPLSTILNLEQQIRGTIAGFMMPSFVVDLPGGGGKRLATSYTEYDRDTGLSTWEAPGIKPGTTFNYYDPQP